MKPLFCLLLAALIPVPGAIVHAQTPETTARERDVLARLMDAGLRDVGSYDLLKELTGKAGHRLSGSPGAEKGVALAREMMVRLGFNNVHLEPVTVPHWERGSPEDAVALLPGRQSVRLKVSAFGGSIGTPRGGITAEVVEVSSFEELTKLGTGARGKIIFFNRPMDPVKLNTFEAYGGAVAQRSRGAVEAAKVGGVAAIVRSMTLALDDVPHTGAMRYAKGTPRVPAAAISTRGANRLSGLLKGGRSVRVRLRLTCRSYADTSSANVIGELTGNEEPEEVIVVGGHLDAWDTGDGAHDDGAGCMQAIEALSLLKRIGVTPRRTVRAVMFMNEENGLRGGKAYAVDPRRQAEKHIALIESDLGGFAPLGFTIEGDTTVVPRVLRWKPLFDLIGMGRLVKGSSGADVSPLVAKGIPGFGLDTENQRYFDYHHSANDTIDKVNPRELELGAIAEALLCYLLSEEGL